MTGKELFPREVTSNIPFMTLTGSEKLHIEQHRGLIAYQPEEIVLRTACGLVHITGEALLFKTYNASDAVITGRIGGISIEGTGGRR